MGATTLLHEAYLNLNSRERVAFPDRSRFLNTRRARCAASSSTTSASRRAQKRGGDDQFVADR